MAVLGKVVITPKGEYTSNVQYDTLDCVFDGGSTWLAKQATKGNPPPTDGSESNDYWQLLARGVPIDTKDSTVTFEEAEGDAELQSGMSHSTLWGLVKFKFADILSSLANKLSLANIANNLVTTESGFVLDARQGKALQDQINTLNNNLGELITKFDGTLPVLTDANTALTFGAYTANPDTANTPISTHGIIEVKIGAFGTWIYQRFTIAADGSVYDRRCINDVWSDWVKRY